MLKKPLKEVDIRVLDYHLRKGLIRDEDLKKSLAELPDEAANATQVEVKMEPVRRG
jgi:hypothetical protein